MAMRRHLPRESFPGQEYQRGLLFHYFGSKEKLYETMTEFAFEYVLDLVEDNDALNESDIFLRFQCFSSLKHKAMEESPHIYGFLRRVMEESPSDSLMARFSQRIVSLKEKAYTENIDYSLFKPEVDIMKAVEMIHWTLYGATQKLIHDRNMTFEELLAEIQKYMDMLRELFYA